MPRVGRAQHAATVPPQGFASTSIVADRSLGSGIHQPPDVLNSVFEILRRVLRKKILLGCYDRRADVLDKRLEIPAGSGAHEVHQGKECVQCLALQDLDGALTGPFDTIRHNTFIIRVIDPGKEVV